MLAATQRFKVHKVQSMFGGVSCRDHDLDLDVHEKSPHWMIRAKGEQLCCRISGSLIEKSTVKASGCKELRRESEFLEDATITELNQGSAQTVE